MGRFLQRNPIGTKDDVNLYRYVANSSIMYTDPTGKVKMVLAETGERLLRWTAEGLQFLLDPEVANSPGEYTYEQDIQNGKEMEYAIKNPSGPSLVIAVILPIPGAGKKELIDGAIMKVDDALTAAEKFLGKGYKELSNGRFVSEDGLKQVRMGMDDILGKHGGGPHINFEQLDANGKLIPDSKIHIFLNN